MKTSIQNTIKNMPIGTTFQHRHYPKYSYRVLAATKKGYKLMQTEQRARSEKNTIQWWQISDIISNADFQSISTYSD